MVPEFPVQVSTIPCLRPTPRFVSLALARPDQILSESANLSCLGQNTSWRSSTSEPATMKSEYSHSVFSLWLSLSLSLSLLLLIGARPLLHAEQFGLFTCRVFGDTIEITDYPEDAVSEVQIPNSVTLPRLSSLLAPARAPTLSV